MKISALNDSTFVAALVYISSVVLVALVLVTFALRNYINIRGAIFSGGNLLLAYVYLILMFVPKVYKETIGVFLSIARSLTCTADTFYY